MLDDSEELAACLAVARVIREIEVAVDNDLAVSGSLSKSDSDLRCEDAIGLRH